MNEIGKSLRGSPRDRSPQPVTWTLVAIVGLLPTLAAGGQPAEKLTFEVASVKRSAPITPGQRVFFGPPRGGPGTPDPEQITWTYATMKALLMTAYDMKTYQISGPSWLESERYDVAVKLAAGSSKEQVHAMWQNLLEERFGMKIRRESKEFRVQELVVAKGGSKLKESVDDPNAPIPEGPPKFEDGKLSGPGMITRVEMDGHGPRAHSTARAQPIGQLTVMLSSQLKVPVVDKTGLTGKYDFTLGFVPDVQGPEAGAGVGVTGPEPDIVSAVQEQLGLKLVASKAMLDIVVVEKAEKVPSEN